MALAMASLADTSPAVLKVPAPVACQTGSCTPRGAQGLGTGQGGPAAAACSSGRETQGGWNEA